MKTAQRDGTYTLYLQTGDNDYPLDGWELNRTLEKGVAYRIEHRWERRGAGQYGVDVRIDGVDEDANFIRGDGDPQNPADRLSADPTLAFDEQCFRSLFIGNNGPGGEWENLDEDQDFIHWGGVEVRGDRWPGAY